MPYSKSEGGVALLLAAGLGTRLRPVTETTPKCLVKVDGTPILRIWIKKLTDAGINKILVNTFYHSSIVEQSIKQWPEAKNCVDIIREPRLRGTGGTFIDCLDKFTGALGLVIHADNLMEEGLEGIIKAHEVGPRTSLTMLAFRSKNPSSCGIIKCDERGIVREFHEKKQNPPGNLANGAVWVFDRDFSRIARRFENATDFAADIACSMIGDMKAYVTKGYFYDIGTLEMLREARAAARASRTKGLSGW